MSSIGGKHQGERIFAHWHSFLSFSFLFLISFSYWLSQVEHHLGRNCPAQSESKICVHHRDLKPAKTCEGDSGGPLLVKEGGVEVLVGVTSYSPIPTCPPDATSCVFDSCDETGVAIFTKVQSFLPWIKNITGIGEHEPFFV